MPVVFDQNLYNWEKEKAIMIYEKPSAYKFGYIVKTYKSLGGKYKDDNDSKKSKKMV